MQTRLVILDVVAQDKKGIPVTDLKAANFKVLEDGRKQSISVFAFQHPEAAPSSASSPPSAELPHDVFRNRPQFKSNSALNVILLDGLNTTVINQFYVRDAMIRFLEKLPQGQPVAIYGLGSKLRLLQDFTTDLTVLKHVVQVFKGESSHDLASPTGTPEVPMTLQGWASQIADERAPAFKKQIEDFAQETSSDQKDQQVQHTLTALTSLARMLAGYPGRKNLIWITEAIPMNLFASSYDVTIHQEGSDLVRSLPNGNSEAHTRRSYESQLALLANLFADAQVAVYPIDARGLVGSPLFNPANNVSGQGAMGGLAMRSEGKQAEELFSAHSNMSEIAAKTGGKPYYNRNAIDRAVLGDIEDGSTYYVVGYYPENKEWNGKFRNIRVSVDRADVKLRYRLGYYAIDRFQYGKGHPRQADIDFAQALDPDSPVATALQFEAKVMPPTPEQKKVIVRYIVDPHQILFQTTPEGLQHAQVDCAARAFSPKNIDRPITTEAARIEASLKPDAYQKISRTWFPCEISLDLPAGSYFLRLAVRDNSTGLVGSINAQVSVPSQPVADTKTEKK